MSLSFSSFPNPFPFHYHPHFSRKSKSPSLTITAVASTPPPPQTTNSVSFRTKPPNQINVLVAGSTGYIGKFVVEELCRRGFNVVAVARRGSPGVSERAAVCFSDVTDPASLNKSLDALAVRFDVAVSCLASRSGGIKDSWNIDYTATKNTLAAARRLGAAHFVLLSAICVQKPQLAFQNAKLKFESDLAGEAASDPAFSYSIVRPTAFFKSLAGQVETVKDGKPYVMFGDGRICSCKPISERDLAAFIADCVTDKSKAGRVLPVGGPGKAVTPAEQAEMIFRQTGRKPWFVKVPIGVMDFAIGVLEFLARVFPAMEDAAEYGRIGRYYAVESMLVMDPATGEYREEETPAYGKDTLEEFFARVVREGMAGQELGEQSIF